MLCGIISACTVKCCITDYQPEQIHLSVTLDPSEMVVSWVTYLEVTNPIVTYWEQSQSGNMTIMVIPADHSTYTDGGWEGVIYNATLINLKPSKHYRYTITSNDNNNYYYDIVEHHFTTRMDDSSAPLESRSLYNNSVPFIPGISASCIAYTGDIGTTSNSYESTAGLTTLVQNGTIQSVVVGGDLSYADGDEHTWDQYLRMIEHYADSIPVMAAPGNHENYYHFAAYNHRFFMPNEQSGSSSKQYFSFNYEKIHFVSWSVEELHGVDLRPDGKQRKWLENDLQQANLERNVRPWIVLFGHRPFYCSSDSSDCTDVASELRDLLEDLINEYHIDVVLQAHKHNYERTYPVYQSTRTADNYQDPAAPMYYVVGVGGVDKNSDFDVVEPLWSADRDDKYGYLLMSAPDEYTFEMAYVSKSYNVHDSATITRTQLPSVWTFPH